MNFLDGRRASLGTPSSVWMYGPGPACQCPARTALQRDEDIGRFRWTDLRNVRLRGVTVRQALAVYTGRFSGFLIPGRPIGDHSCT